MADARERRYLPPPRRKGASTPPPDWFVREAIAAFELSHTAVIAMFVIADNMNALGESRTSKSLLSDRGRMSRQTAQNVVDELVDHGLLVELDPRSPGRMMRYAIPKHMPYNPMRRT